MTWTSNPLAAETCTYTFAGSDDRYEASTSSFTPTTPLVCPSTAELGLTKDQLRSSAWRRLRQDVPGEDWRSPRSPMLGAGTSGGKGRQRITTTCTADNDHVHAEVV